MKQHWTTWLLSGALVASLQWNVRTLFPEAPAEGLVSGTPCALQPRTRAAPDVNAEVLGITPEQAERLRATCDEACGLSDALESKTEERLKELRARLAAPELDADGVRALAREISDLRSRSLDACVDSVIRVRSILTPAQVGTLLVDCCAPNPNEKGRAAPACDE